MATKKDTPREQGAARNTKPVEGHPADELARHIAAVLNPPDGGTDRLLRRNDLYEMPYVTIR